MRDTRRECGSETYFGEEERKKERKMKIKMVNGIVILLSCVSLILSGCSFYFSYVQRQKKKVEMGKDYGGIYLEKPVEGEVYLIRSDWKVQKLEWKGAKKRVLILGQKAPYILYREKEYRYAYLLIRDEEGVWELDLVYREKRGNSDYSVIIPEGAAEKWMEELKDEEKVEKIMAEQYKAAKVFVEIILEENRR